MFLNRIKENLSNNDEIDNKKIFTITLMGFYFMQKVIENIYLNK